MTDFHHELAESLLEYWYEETAANSLGMAKILRESCVSSETYKKALRDIKNGGATIEELRETNKVLRRQLVTALRSKP